MAQIAISQFRAEIPRWTEYVQRPERWVILTAHGREVAALVSVENLKLIWNQQDERWLGPINPATGRPFGAAWVSEHFQGHYERLRDASSHLHPSREEAPWLGRPFDWPPAAAPKRAVEPEAAEETGETERPAPARPWWRFWRR